MGHFQIVQNTIESLTSPPITDLSNASESPLFDPSELNQALSHESFAKVADLVEIVLESTKPTQTPKQAR